ncbi:hypothetical protein H5410_022907 [Solanum commersonii]|uniref:MADS-box domain-containing protein n=1 Tax=Solanum commersonii TaxID=4109 RepID=A0A9J5ZG18_SOLCO|nr:hypothetical protein H5410_022907 [Solanum commersonii]
MGRKIEIKKIEETTKRQVTFSKRRSSLLKKAEEVAICCDADVLFVAFSPSGRLNKFCSQQRVEDMLQRYLKLPNLELQIKKSTLELQIVDANLRDYEPGAEQEPSLHQLCWCESNLKLSLQKILARKMELEKQGNMDVHSVAQQMAPHQFDTNNCISPFSSTIQNQDWMDKGKRVANNSSNYTYTPSFASTSQLGNMSFPQNSLPFTSLQSQQQNMAVDVQQNPTQTFGQLQSQQQNMEVDVQQNPTQILGQAQSQQQNMVVGVQKNPTHTFGQSQSQQQNMIVNVQQNPTQAFGQLHSQQQNMMVYIQQNSTQSFGQSQNQQQNMVVDVHQNSTQTFGQSQNQQQNMVVDVQQNSTQTFGQSQAQLTFGESSDNLLTNFWHNICAFTRYGSSPLANTGTQLNTPSQLGLEYAHSNWNINLNNNNDINHIIQQTDQSSIQSTAIASNVNGFNYPIEENTMGNNEYFAETTHENDAWEWDDVFLNEGFNGDDF